MTFALGAFVGLALGLVGGGGSIVTVPLLVGPLAVSAHAATTMSLVIVGITAAWASLPHARSGNVLWSRAFLFGGVGIVGTSVGSQLSRSVSPKVLLAGFVVLMVVAAIATWRRSSRTSTQATALLAASLAGTPLTIATAGAASSPSLRSRMRAHLPAACPLVDFGPFIGAAVGVGLLTGFFGVGGGFLIVPALVLVARLPMSQAIGTSLPIIAINSFTALAGRLGSGATIDWPTTLTFTAGAVLMALVAGTVSTRLPAAALGRGFALVVLALAGYLSLQVI